MNAALAQTFKHDRFDCIDDATGFVVSVGWTSKAIAAFHGVTANAAEIASAIICCGSYAAPDGTRWERAA